MSNLIHFKNLLSGGWTNTKDAVSYKIIGSVLCLESSNGTKDWIRNINVLPAIRRIGGIDMIIPAGMARAWDTLRPILEQSTISFIAGYSHGGWLAAISSAHTGIPAVSFGCPGVAVMTKRNIHRFDKCTFISGYRDLFTIFQGIYSHGLNQKILTGQTKRDGESLSVWISGHSPDMYLQLLEQQ